GAGLLVEEARRRRAGGGQLYFYSLRKPVEELLERGGYMAELGRENVFGGKREAIGGVFTRLDLSICATCRARIFEESASVPGPEGARCRSAAPRSFCSRCLRPASGRRSRLLW